MAPRVKTGEPEEVAELVLQNLHLRQLASIFAWSTLY